MNSSTPTRDLDRANHPWLRRLLALFVGGVLIGSAAYIMIEVPFFEVSPRWGLAGRMLAVLGAAAMVAAFSDRPVLAVVGAVIGVLVARVLHPAMSSDARLCDLDALLWLCVVPGAMASFSNWRVGAAGAVSTIAAGLAVYLIWDKWEYAEWNPHDPQWWRGWWALGGIIVLYGAPMSLLSWTVAAIVMYAGSGWRRS